MHGSSSSSLCGGSNSGSSSIRGGSSSSLWGCCPLDARGDGFSHDPVTALEVKGVWCIVGVTWGATSALSSARNEVVCIEYPRLGCDSLLPTSEPPCVLHSRLLAGVGVWFQ